jgi:ferredoxin
MALKLEADRSLCIGAGQCLVAASNVTLDESGKVQVLNDGWVADVDRLDVEDAVATCPTKALSLHEESD